MKRDKQKAIAKFEQLKNEAERLKHASTSVEDQNFQKWRQDVKAAITHYFNSDNELKDFSDISFRPHAVSASTPHELYQVGVSAYREGIDIAIGRLSSFIAQINDYWEESEESSTELSAKAKIELIITRFHLIAQQLVKDRHDKRNTLEIKDEYDVQDLFHALLKLYFDDIRREEPVPSHGGAASRVDFLLKQEQIIVEIKHTRAGLSDKKIGEELIIDSQRYQTHTDYKHLICFVYDPDGVIKNPRGLENDLTKEINGRPVSVLITPK